jgi:hypothetical protein
MVRRSEVEKVERWKVEQAEKLKTVWLYSIGILDSDISIGKAALGEMFILTWEKATLGMNFGKKFGELNYKHAMQSGLYSVWLRAGRPGDRGSIPGRGESIFYVAPVSRPALRPTQPPVQWVPGVLHPGLKRGRGVTLTTHPHLVPRSRMSRGYI